MNNDATLFAAAYNGRRAQVDDLIAKDAKSVHAKDEVCERDRHQLCLLVLTDLTPH